MIHPTSFVLATLALLALDSSAHAAAPGTLDRQPRLVSVAAHQVINEVRTDSQFSFERCDFFHVDGSNLADELKARPFVNCAALGRPQPLAERAAVDLELNEALTNRRRDLADPRVWAWGLNGFIQGAVLGGLSATAARRVIARSTLNVDNLISDVTRYGGFVGLAASWSQTKQAIHRQGVNRQVLGVLDAEMPNDVYVLDQRTNDRLAHARAMDNFASILARVTRKHTP